MSAFDRVIAQPASLAARYALLAEWKATNHPQAALLDKQLELRLITGSDLRSSRANRLVDSINALIDQHGRAWAGRVADLVDLYQFHRGLVAEVSLSGERFLEVMPELQRVQPVQHVNLRAPYGSIEAIASSPLLAKLSSLHLANAGAVIGDRGAIALANSPHVANLVELSLMGDEITQVGVEAIASSPYLANAKRISFANNPYDPTPRVIDEGDDNFLAFTPPAAGELEARFGKRPWLAAPIGYLPTWPPDKDELALVNDCA